MNKLWGVKTPNEARKKLKEVIIPIDKPKNFEEVALSMVGEEIYETFFKGYTIKQWQKDPKELPSFILKRLPYRLNYDDNYFNHKYQGMPVEGYTKMMERIQDGADIQLDINFFELEHSYWKKQAKQIIYTGKIDEYFNYELGDLEWVGVDFEHTNKKLYMEYKKLINKETDTIFGGRLGDFKYYDMHQVIGSALKCVGDIVW